jgi:hypothetical protein
MTPKTKGRSGGNRPTLKTCDSRNSTQIKRDTQIKKTEFGFPWVSLIPKSV